MKIFIIVCCVLFFVALSCTHNTSVYGDVPFNRITIVRNDTITQFYTKPLHTKLTSKILPGKYYAWYRADSIILTRGGYSGKILHGEYIESYPSRALKEKGNYNEGLKEGEWQTWYKNGEKQTVSNWKQGEKQGAFVTYDEKGAIKTVAHYIAGKENGNFSYSLANNKTREVVYKDGKILSDTTYIK